jgi:hypothetical protein
MSIREVKLQLLNPSQAKGIAGAFAEELAKNYINTFRNQVEHLKTDEEFKELLPSQAMYTSLVHLMAKAIFSEVITRSNFTGEKAVQILEENLKMLFADISMHLDAMAMDLIIKENFEKDDGDEGSSN